MDLNQTIFAILKDSSPYTLYESTLKTEVECRLGIKVEATAFDRALTHLQFIQLIGTRSEQTTGQTGYFIQGGKVVVIWR